jgi:intracellular sulfur oxidation DsrE/DsrF family protein
MKTTLVILLVSVPVLSMAQARVNPVIKNFGGVFAVPYADVKPDPNLDYKIIIEVATGSATPDTLNWALVNVARLLNLHVSGGVAKEHLHVVLAIHAGAAYSVMDNPSYFARYGVDNPNLPLLKELAASGVDLVVCGQSLIARAIDREKLAPNIKIATSMLTTLTTYQLRGYASLKF